MIYLKVTKPNKEDWNYFAFETPFKALVYIKHLDHYALWTMQNNWFEDIEPTMYKRMK
jgi:hypothetical protein